MPLDTSFSFLSSQFSLHDATLPVHGAKVDPALGCCGPYFILPMTLKITNVTSGGCQSAIPGLHDEGPSSET